MAEAILIKRGGGSGTGSEDCTATKDNVLAGYTAVTADSDDEAVAGTMPNNGAQDGSLNCGQSKTIPAGYTSGGTVRANSLASQTGVDSGKTAAGAAQILTGYQAWANGNKVSGSMANQGAKTSTLNCGGSYTIPAGYHNGSGKVTANSLASQTSANAVAAHILQGETAWVNGVKITGTMTVQSALSFSAAARSHDTIRISWKNPAKGPWQGVKIRMATSGYPGTGGGTLKYTGTGSSAAAGATSYVDITGLSPNTTYYFTCYSYATGMGDGTGTNVTAKTADRTPRDIFESIKETRLRLCYTDYDSGDYNDYTIGGSFTDAYTFVTDGSKMKDQTCSATMYRAEDGKYYYGVGIDYAQGNEYTAPELPQSDIDILKTYKYKLLNGSGEVVLDFGQIVYAVVSRWHFNNANVKHNAYALCTRVGEYIIRGLVSGYKVVFYK